MERAAGSLLRNELLAHCPRDHRRAPARRAMTCSLGCRAPVAGPRLAEPATVPPWRSHRPGTTCRERINRSSATGAVTQTLPPESETFYPKVSPRQDPVASLKHLPELLSLQQASIVYCVGVDSSAVAIAHGGDPVSAAD